MVHRTRATTTGRPSPRDVATRLIRRWYPDPVIFSRDIFGIEPWDWPAGERPSHGRASQADLLRAVANNRQTAARSGQKTGKSADFAILSFWWAITRPRGKAVLTEPAGHQLRNILWPEIHAFYSLAAKRGFPIGGKLYDDPFSGWRKPDGSQGIICLATDKPDKIQGVSGPENLWMVDEGSGFPDILWPAIQGNLAGGGKLATFGNPLRVSGFFYEIFTRRAATWKTLHISSLDSPNIRAGLDLVPGLANEVWHDEFLREYGEDSAEYQARVLGNFPTQGSNAVVSITTVEAAQGRWGTIAPTGRLQIGVDVARFGDDESVITPRRGRVAGPQVVIHGAPTTAVAGRALALARDPKWATKGERPLIVVDETGLGAGVVDILSEASDVETIGVNASEKADSDDYAKMRDQLWFAAETWLREGGAIPGDAEHSKLYSELVAPCYSFDSRGRRKVESKDEIKKRLRRSPDRADSLCLAVVKPQVDDVTLFAF